ncbi:squalene/phytoene synthase family protein [uncultured Jatrophihabitans sp.]|uniref:squalene/phytoene synthase family protein n=1 Tax=uncultured Jatrophihabitans sp. TaxID=1610747 RepID=UPI0035CA4B88
MHSGDGSGGSRDSASSGDRATLDQVAVGALGQMHAENFPVALRVLPRRARRQLVRVYAFARFVDDVGDEAEGDRAALLGIVRTELDAQHRGETSGLEPVRDLAPVFDAGVPLQPFADLVEANVVDQRVHRYATFDDLLGYCALSAAPVGRIVLHLAGSATPRNVADSDAVCAALQVLEHCQDVREDARAGRVYLSADQLQAAGLARDLLPDALTGTRTPGPVRLVVADHVERARAMLRDGAPLVGRLRGWARFAVAGFVAGGSATADALTAAHYDVLGRDLGPGKVATAAHTARLLTRRP